MGGPAAISLICACCNCGGMVREVLNPVIDDCLPKVEQMLIREYINCNVKLQGHVVRAAKKHVARNPENTAFDAKRLMGCNFADPLVQVDIKCWSFNCYVGFEDKPMIEVNYTGGDKRFQPVEISSMVLTKMFLTQNIRTGRCRDCVTVMDPEDINVCGYCGCFLCGDCFGFHIH